MLLGVIWFIAHPTGKRLAKENSDVWEAIIQTDLFLFHLINGFAGTHHSLDPFMVFISQNDLIKGMLVWTVWWGLWFQDKREPPQIRAKLLATIIVSIVTIFIGRALSLALPFRLRPIHNPEIGASLPINMNPLDFDGWSSLPSDHAVLYFALATSLYCIHRTIGIVFLLHAIFIIALPRIYAGLHFPSDIVIGGLIGVTIAMTFMFPLTRRILESRVFILEERYAYLFYPVIFLISVQSATMFNSSRAFLSVAYSGIKRIAS